MVGDSSKDNFGKIWVFVLKAHLAITPAVFAAILTWAIWVTSHVFEARAFMGSGERFSRQDGRDLERRSAEARQVMADKLEVKITRLESIMDRTSSDVNRMLGILEQVAKDHPPGNQRD